VQRTAGFEEYAEADLLQTETKCCDSFVPVGSSRDEQIFFAPFRGAGR